MRWEYIVLWETFGPNESSERPWFSVWLRAEGHGLNFGVKQLTAYTIQSDLSSCVLF